MVPFLLLKKKFLQVFFTCKFSPLLVCRVDKCGHVYQQHLQFVGESIANKDENKNGLPDVYAYANRCPLKDGVIIYAFRNLYNALTGDINKFENNFAAVGVFHQ